MGWLETGSRTHSGENVDCDMGQKWHRALCPGTIKSVILNELVHFSESQFHYPQKIMALPSQAWFEETIQLNNCVRYKRGAYVMKK